MRIWLAATIAALLLSGCGDTTEYVPSGTKYWELVVMTWAVPNVEEYAANYQSTRNVATYDDCKSNAELVLDASHDRARINAVCVPKISNGYVRASGVLGWKDRVALGLR